MKLTDTAWTAIRERILAELATLSHASDEAEHVADAIMAALEDEISHA